MAADNRGPEMDAVAIAFTASSLICVVLRCYTKIVIVKHFYVEDWLAIVTMIFQLFFCACVLLGVAHGLGQHVDVVAADDRITALMWKWAGMWAYIVVSTLVKFVVGIFIFRLCNHKSWQRTTIWVILSLVGVFNAFYVFIAIFQCQPAEYYWYRYTENSPVTGKCFHHSMATIPTYIAILLGVGGDWILALMPISLIRKAQLDLRTKISVSCILAVGSIASIATIARIPYAKQLLSNPDYLYNFTDLADWSMIETGLAITASSLATLRPLFVKLKIFTATQLSGRFNSAKGFGSSSRGGITPSTTRVSMFSFHPRSRITETINSEQYPIESTDMEKGAPSTSTTIQVDHQIEMSVMTVPARTLASGRNEGADSLDLVPHGLGRSESRAYSTRQSWRSHRKGTGLRNDSKSSLASVPDSVRDLTVSTMNYSRPYHTGGRGSGSGGRGRGQDPLAWLDDSSASSEEGVWRAPSR